MSSKLNDVYKDLDNILTYTESEKDWIRLAWNSRKDLNFGLRKCLSILAEKGFSLANGKKELMNNTEESLSKHGKQFMFYRIMYVKADRQLKKALKMIPNTITTN